MRAPSSIETTDILCAEGLRFYIYDRDIDIKAHKISVHRNARTKQGITSNMLKTSLMGAVAANFIGPIL